VKIFDVLIEGVWQHAFIIQEEMMSAYTIKGTPKEKTPLLMKETTLQETFLKATQQNISSSLDDLLPGPPIASDNLACTPNTASLYTQTHSNNPQI
jgi:hypothetical protein